MGIPLFDLKRQYLKLRPEILEIVDRVISSGKVILGNEVREFEKEIASYIGTKYAIGVSSGTDALVISVKALGIGNGDFVITTPYTFFATASCIVRNGAIPIFLDADETYNLDLDQVELFLSKIKEGKMDETIVQSGNVEEKIKVVSRILNLYKNINPERVKAVIPVHLFGRTMDLERLEKIRKRYNVKIIEDAAQSIGSEWKYNDGKVKKSGSIGDLSILSFFPTKNLGTYGDGGMILTNDEELVRACRKLRVHGAEKKYYHEIIGYNARLDEIHAGILRIKLRYLDEWIEKRYRIAKMYSEELSKIPIVESVPNVDWRDNVRYHVYHQYVIKFKDFNIREKVINEFKKRDIGFSIYYPLPLHLQKCFENLKYKEGFLPISEKLSKTTLALPMFPELREDEVEDVIKTIEVIGCQ